ncbi:hypothetical protein PF010_g3312 [Phytophthora fragariae]|uniref:Secreted protein n=2 Tax=Phytophthora TaxID=4783 RepID=A0A6A4AEU8_9STRA|nr:hypothetical protein PF003_g30956 [Phytophthora fragariae]KAE9048898.1 hypothetical protein PR002_g173 [Phytophthora rubi]KAE9049995.1 hypothetical protein PR001_g2818 [Phytophthora rubi]KAE9132100.1 hypothetical protein PF010_g3312 [Phytophthora fragariae]KAE9253489.1 hypothetical protein PF002_g3300 [Phytophthora fragariae]
MSLDIFFIVVAAASTRCSVAGPRCGILSTIPPQSTLCRRCGTGTTRGEAQESVPPTVELCVKSKGSAQSV